MVDYSDDEFEKMLVKLTHTANAIKSLSTWCMARYRYRTNMISVWMNVIKKTEVEKRLNLFYLANDVIQLSKNTKHNKFVDEWAPVIEKAILYVK